MSLAAESDAVVEATGSHLALRTSIVLANWRGRDGEAVALIDARRQDVLRRGEGLWLFANDWGSAIRYNGLGRYEDALAAAERAADDRGWAGAADPAAGGADRGCRAQRPARTRDWSARPTRGDCARCWHGLGARNPRPRGGDACRGSRAERLYREATNGCPRVKTRSQTLARAHLLYGEWLRREHRRVDAREQLRVAHTMLSDMGMEAFAERARREL